MRVCFGCTRQDNQSFNSRNLCFGCEPEAGGLVDTDKRSFDDQIKEAIASSKDDEKDTRIYNVIYGVISQISSFHVNQIVEIIDIALKVKQLDFFHMST